MKNRLPDIIAHLRAERKITQKKAAADLGISQARLSHYENGIRECSLDFLCRAADYYGVSTDYLLGRTDFRSASFPDGAGAYIKPEEEKYIVYNSKRLRAPSRKDIFEAMNVLLDVVRSTGSENLEAEVALYLCVGIYRLYLAIYIDGGIDSENVFKLPKMLAISETAAMFIRLENRISAHIQGEYIYGAHGVKSPELVRTNKNYLAQRYPEAARSLFMILDIIENCMPPRN